MYMYIYIYIMGWSGETWERWSMNYGDIVGLWWDIIIIIWDAREFTMGCMWFYLYWEYSIQYRTTSSTAQGGGGSFKNRKHIGEVGCCESRMANRIHWWTERWLRSPLVLSLSLSFSGYLPTYLPTYLSLSLSFSLFLSLSLSLSLSLPPYLTLPYLTLPYLTLPTYLAI